MEFDKFSAFGTTSSQTVSRGPVYVFLVCEFTVNEPFLLTDVRGFAFSIYSFFVNERACSFGVHHPREKTAVLLATVLRNLLSGVTSGFNCCYNPIKTKRANV